MDTSILKDIGFKENEIKVYLALLKLKSSSVTKIADTARMDRSQTYDILEKLINKGVVSFVHKNNVKHFQPNDPSVILKKIKKNEEDFLKLLPMLDGLFKEAKEDTNVEVFKGKEGLKAIFNDIIKTKKEQIMFGGLKELETKAPFIVKHFLKKMEQNRIKEKVLYIENEDIIRIKTGKYKYISKEYLSPVNTTIYDNKIVFIIPPFFLIRIKSKELAASYRKYFNLWWKVAKT